MSVSDDGAQDKQKGAGKEDNVIRLGTEALIAIAEELRRMYDADLRSRPSERLERLIQNIERGDDQPAKPDHHK